MPIDVPEVSSSLMYRLGVYVCVCLSVCYHSRHLFLRSRCTDKAHDFMKITVAPLHNYYQHAFYMLLAMIRQLGIPTWLLHYQPLV